MTRRGVLTVVGILAVSALFSYAGYRGYNRDYEKAVGQPVPIQAAPSVPPSLLARPGSGEPDDGPLVDEDLLAKGRKMSKAEAGRVLAAMGM